MNPICRYPVPTVAELPDDLRQRILEVQEKAGFVPNVFLALARRPAELRAFLAYHDALLLREGGLTKAEKEMVIVATSGANRCLYCVVAHGAILRVYAKAPRLADQLATNPLKAEVNPRQAALLAFAMKVCLDAQGLTESDYAALKAHGLDDEDAWDLISIVGLFGMSNRIANSISLMPNDEFYLMGRQPRSKT
ncbi:putative peroxidase-related enzyme [Inhella inkyongensis]|uniref:Putative peroxidase-related enzyme n=1 Tax=Inhella inkyongensis TaxID=392593 RepID=A0A840S239_9BURK|nr:peroxidase-related enzyme [Inhella inkyongensis]MBB5203813.1 putative peroxidase-related enzyme [Inhella inkyongensis]